METLEALSRRIGTTRELQSVARTMKSLSAVNVRQYEQAAGALDGYARTIELGFAVALRRREVSAPEPAAPKGGTLGLVFGSDHGLCGRFNEQIVDFAEADLAEREAPIVRLTVGGRAAARQETLGVETGEPSLLPGTASGLGALAEALLLKIDACRETEAIGRVVVYHNRRPAGQSTAAPHARQLLPLSDEWLRRLQAEAWPSPVLPTFSMAAEALLASLTSQYLFIAIVQAGAESMAAEHAARLAAMQAAEKNIADHLDEMTMAFRRLRQEMITEEMLDIFAGYETLRTRR